MAKPAKKAPATVNWLKYVSLLSAAVNIGLFVLILPGLLLMMAFGGTATLLGPAIFLLLFILEIPFAFFIQKKNKFVTWTAYFYAILSLIMFPFGTVIGIVKVVLLSRSESRNYYPASSTVIRVLITGAVAVALAFLFMLYPLKEVQCGVQHNVWELQCRTRCLSPHPWNNFIEGSYVVSVQGNQQSCTCVSPEGEGYSSGSALIRDWPQADEKMCGKLQVQYNFTSEEYTKWERS